MQILWMHGDNSKDAGRSSIPTNNCRIGRTFRVESGSLSSQHTSTPAVFIDLEPGQSILAKVDGTRGAFLTNLGTQSVTLRTVILPGVESSNTELLEDDIFGQEREGKE